MTHRCACILVNDKGVRDRCRQTVESDDAPFCAECEIEGHNQLPAFDARLDDLRETTP